MFKLEDTILLLSGCSIEHIKRLVQNGWLEESSIEGVGTVYYLTKKGFRQLVLISA